MEYLLAIPIAWAISGITATYILDRKGILGCDKLWKTGFYVNSLLAGPLCFIEVWDHRR